MTRIERLEARLDELYHHRSAAVKQNNFMWMQQVQDKIDELQKELIEAKKYAPMKLSQWLKDKDDSVRDRVFKVLLKISLAADFLNDCAEECKAVFKDLDLNEHSISGDVNSMCQLSQRVASFVVQPDMEAIANMMLDNADFIQTCSDAADAHLAKTLNL